MDNFTMNQLDILKDKCNSLEFSEFKQWYNTTDINYLSSKYQQFQDSPITWLGYADSTRYLKFTEYLNK